MEFKITKEQILAIATAFGLGTSIGVYINKYHNLKNTPEETIRRLEAATAEKKAAEKSYAEQYGKYRDAYDKLVNTKQAYQDEIRPELESKIRQELKKYIDKADETYAKAKHDNELASLKLELIRQYKKNNYEALSDGIKFNINI